MERTQQHFEEQLSLLAEKLLLLGGMVEEAIGRSVGSLVNRDSKLAQEVIDSDRDVDKLELQIDGLCVELLALHQPMASDLRFITTAMKITPELERVGDYAVNIAERALELNEEPPLKTVVDMPSMAQRAQEMIRRALDSFVRRDAHEARAVLALDDELDRRMEQVFRILVSHMLEDPKTITRAIRLTFVAKHFERIGDQATNISEQVVFMTEAQVIKHSGESRSPTR